MNVSNAERQWNCRPWCVPWVGRCVRYCSIVMIKIHSTYYWQVNVLLWKLFVLLTICIVYTRHTLKQHACLPHRELCFPTTLDTKKRYKKRHTNEKKKEIKIMASREWKKKQNIKKQHWKINWFRWLDCKICAG